MNTTKKGYFLRGNIDKKAYSDIGMVGLIRRFAVASASGMQRIICFWQPRPIKPIVYIVCVNITLTESKEYPVLANILGFDSMRSRLRAWRDSSVLVRPNIFSLLIPGTNPAYLGTTHLLLATGLYYACFYRNSYSDLHVVVTGSIMIRIGPADEAIFTNGLCQVWKLSQGFS